MLSQLVRLCDDRYQNHSCNNCSYGVNCPHNCGQCLEYVHFPQKAPEHRCYDCTNMMDFYVCKYAYRYTSELKYAFARLQDLKTKDNLKVLSLGCGPCTDLLALDILRQKNIYCFNILEYQGVEINPDVWRNIHSNLESMVNENENWSFNIVPQNIFQYINEYLTDGWKPNLIVMQYVLSDMCKNMSRNQVNETVDLLANYIDSCDDKTCVVCNDINLSSDRGGELGYFERLADAIRVPKRVFRFHFNNNYRDRHYDYGEEYSNNTINIEYPDDAFVEQLRMRYNFFESCASAQMLIKKVENNDN